MTKEIEDKIKSLQISPDAYELWRNNIVTQRFMLEAELELSDRRRDVPHGTTCEEIALSHVKNSASCDTLEAMIDWKPQELQIDN